MATDSATPPTSRGPSSPPPSTQHRHIDLLGPPRNPNFRGRVRERLLLGGWLEAAAGRACVVAGPPGVGKSALAAEVAHRGRDRGAYIDAVVWVAAGDEGRLGAAVGSFCGRAGLVPPQALSSDPDLCARTFRAWLQTNKNWLLVLDNVADWTLIQGYLPVNHGACLITTRNPETRGGAGPYRMKLDVLTPEDGAEVLLAYLGRRSTKSTRTTSAEERALAEAVSAELGGLPLALEYTARYARKHFTDLRTLRDRLRNDDVLARPIWTEKQVVSPFAPATSLCEIWDLCLATLRPEGLAVLECLAFLAPGTAVPESLWNARLEDEPQRVIFTRTLRDLHSRGLIKRSESHGVGLLTMHRVPQRLMRLRLELCPRLHDLALEHAVTMTRRACPRRTVLEVPDEEDGEACRRVLPHVLSLQGHAAKHDSLPRPLALAVAKLLADAGYYVHYDGDSATALSLAEAGQRLCDITAEAAPLEPAAAPVQAALLLIAAAARNALGPGARGTALRHCREALALVQGHRRGEDERENTLQAAEALQALGSACLEAGDYGGAALHLHQALGRVEKHATAAARPAAFAVAYAGLAYAQLGRRCPPGEALRWIDKAVAVMEPGPGGRKRAAHRRSILQFRFDKAVVLLNAGRFRDARAMAGRCLGEREALLGPTAPGTLDALYWVANAAYHQQNYREAERCLDDALRRSESSLWLAVCKARAQYRLSETLEALREELPQAVQLRRQAHQATQLDTKQETSMADFDMQVPIYSGRSTGNLWAGEDGQKEQDAQLLPQDKVNERDWGEGG